MERQKHSFATLFDSLVKYSLNKSIIVDYPSAGCYKLTFGIRYNDLHCVLNICKSTLDVEHVNFDFHASTVVCEVQYNISLPF